MSDETLLQNFNNHYRFEFNPGPTCLHPNGECSCFRLKPRRRPEMYLTRATAQQAREMFQICCTCPTIAIIDSARCILTFSAPIQQFAGTHWPEVFNAGEIALLLPLPSGPSRMIARYLQGFRLTFDGLETFLHRAFQPENIGFPPRAAICPTRWTTRLGDYQFGDLWIVQSRDRLSIRFDMPNVVNVTGGWHLTQW